MKLIAVYEFDLNRHFDFNATVDDGGRFVSAIGDTKMPRRKGAFLG